MPNSQGSRVGTTFGPYLLKQLLGRGGMGEVYRAEHTVKQWTVAVKLMSETISQDPVFRKRMEREARITGSLLEPHVIPIHDYGEIDGQLFLEMRFIEGRDLSSLLEEDGALTPPRAVAIIHQVASALDAAHAAGVMHRDVKPQNILITGDDFAYLVDFGIASAKTDEKLTQLGTAVGTFKYMAPERFTNDEVTSRADIYALACVLYECLTGTPPYRASNTGVLITAHMMEPIPSPSTDSLNVPTAFDAVIARGMAKNPIARYETAGALAAAAHDALSNTDQSRAHTILQHNETLQRPISAEHAPTVVPAPTTPLTPPTAASEPVSTPLPVSAPAVGDAAPSGTRKRWPIVAAVAAVVVAAGAGVGIWLTSGHSESHGNASGSKTARPPSSDAPTDTQAKLLSLLPPGYIAGACTPATPESGSLWTNAVAMVSCGQNTQPGGPTKATYGLFATPDNLKKAFNDDIGNVSLVNCPGEGDSPVSWHYDESPKVVAGLIACGTYQGRANVIWTNDQKLMLSDVSGDPATIRDLHTWWDNYG
jgi:serine/threonine protein kinase